MRWLDREFGREPWFAPVFDPRLALAAGVDGMRQLFGLRSFERADEESVAGNRVSDGWRAENFPVNQKGQSPTDIPFAEEANAFHAFHGHIYVEDVLPFGQRCVRAGDIGACQQRRLSQRELPPVGQSDGPV